jgi:tRNA A-37 threonylcarbamoyl transferase component Bud32
MPVKLHCIKGVEAGQVLVIPDGGELVIGRSQGADISLDDKLLSRKHVKLSVRDRAALVEDLQSSNGTYLNGERVTRETRVVHSDRIKIGSHIFQVELSEDMVGAPTASGGTAGSSAQPGQPRQIVFCCVCLRAVPSDQAVRNPGYGDACPDCADTSQWPQDMLEGFQLVERIGEGRLGVVFKARHLALQKYVAIKVVRSERIRDETALRRYMREAKIGGRLFHANIVEMYDAAVSRGHYYISMEYIEGETLRQRIGLYGALPVAEIVNYGGRIAEALAYAHDQGVVHRDVTPACIFLGKLGQVKLGDFGLGRLNLPDEPRLTPRGEPLGSLCFMAPEQLEDAGEADARVDIYGLGAALYQGLTGRLPFYAETLPGILDNRRRGALTPLIQARPDCPEALAAIVAHCLAQDRAQRYQTAAELAAALKALPT